MPHVKNNFVWFQQIYLICLSLNFSDNGAFVILANVQNIHLGTYPEVGAIRSSGKIWYLGVSAYPGEGICLETIIVFMPLWSLR